MTTPGERHFWAAPFEMNGEFGGAGPDHAAGLCAPLVSAKLAALLGPRANTTIAIVATDRALTKAQCHRLSVAAHDAAALCLSRAIARAVFEATPAPGDLLPCYRRS